MLLVSGPTALTPPGAAEVTRVESAEEMRQAVLKLLPQATIVIKTAAVSDYRPKSAASQKIKRTGPMTLELEPTDGYSWRDRAPQTIAIDHWICRRNPECAGERAQETRARSRWMPSS